MAKRNYDNWNKEELIREIKKLEKRKKYGIVWEDEKEPEYVATLCKEKLPVLEEDSKKEIETDKNGPVHILIEGDNYHALSVLNYTHKGKIDVIYIDPPYNTGNEGFTYNDKIVDAEDCFRHSKWLSFMDKRLRLAKSLLKSKGAIFISIDDNEQSQLKLLCNEIFGEKNFIAQFIWNKKTGRQNDAKFVSNNHEYILCYCKQVNNFTLNRLPRTDEFNREFQNPNNDPRGPWIHRPLHAKSGSEDNIYEITFPKGIKWKPPKGTYPRFTKKKLLEMYKNNRLWFGKKGNNVPRYKRFLSEVKQGIITNTLLLASDVGNTQKAKEDYRKVMVEVNFDNPKPLGLVKYLTKLGDRSNTIILDFFAGSGTTAQAVLELNREDNGKRKFIVCTNNENNICRKICYPRIKNVFKRIKGKLKYFKTDFVDAEPTDRNKKRLVDKSTEMLCLKEDCFDEVKKGKDFKIFKNSQNKYLGIIYDDEGIEVFKKEVKKMKKKFVVYVFSLDESAREEEFEDMADMVQLKPIPAVILNVYKRIFK